MPETCGPYMHNRIPEGAERLFEEIMEKIFPILIKNTNPYPGTQQTPKKYKH